MKWSASVSARCRATIPRLAIGMIAMSALLAGCAPAFKETYYVGVYDKNDTGTPMQFYRYRLNGTVDFGSKFKFQTGWYPKAALQAFVGEDRDVGTNGGATADSGKDVVVIGPEGAVKALREQYLVALMATDPGPATGALAAFAQSANQQGVAAAMTWRQQRQERIQRKEELRRARAKAGLSLIESTLNTTGNSQAADLLKQLQVVIYPQLDAMQTPAPAASEPAAKDEKKVSGT